MHVLFRCGVGRGKAKAQKIIGEKFRGIGVTDDYGAYKYLFNKHQLCCAHLLRKAIKLMLQHPDRQEYNSLLSLLLKAIPQHLMEALFQRFNLKMDFLIENNLAIAFEIRVLGFRNHKGFPTLTEES